MRIKNLLKIAKDDYPYYEAHSRPFFLELHILLDNLSRHLDSFERNDEFKKGYGEILLKITSHVEKYSKENEKLMTDIQTQIKELEKEIKDLKLENKDIKSDNKTLKEEINDLKIELRWREYCLPVIDEGFIIWSKNFCDDCIPFITPKDNQKYPESPTVIIRVILGTEPDKTLDFDYDLKIKDVVNKWIDKLKIEKSNNEDETFKKFEKICSQNGKYKKLRADDVHHIPANEFWQIINDKKNTRRSFKICKRVFRNIIFR